MDFETVSTEDCGDLLLLGEALGCATIIFVCSTTTVSSACKASLAASIKHLAFSIDFSDNSLNVGSRGLFALAGL